MKKSQSEEKEELNVVYSYLKILTLTGGLAITSLTLIGHTLITRYSKNHSHQVVLKQPVPAITITPVSELPVAEVRQVKAVITKNQSVAKALNEVVVAEISGLKDEIPQITETQSAERDHLNPQNSALEPVITEIIPPAQIDVFPAGYGTFRILIESITSDHFTATLTDMLHQEIVTEQYEVAQGKNEFLLDSGEIPRGDYVLKVSNGIITTQKRVTLK